MRIRFKAEHVAGPGKHLGAGLELAVHLQPDHSFVFDSHGGVERSVLGGEANGAALRPEAASATL
ncbi:MAG: hypothetical protein AAB263_16925, partial [Planctomycetota bacterium]